MRDPSNSAVAAELGILVSPNQAGVCDLLVVGAGPAGLATSVCGAFDGLTVTTFDAVAVGGRATTTSRIENYLCFPPGGELQQSAGICVIAPADDPHTCPALDQQRTANQKGH